MPLTPHRPGSLRFDNTYVRLPERFYNLQRPTAVSAPSLVRLNDLLAAQLGFDPQDLRSPQSVQILAGNAIATGSEPLAMAYAGHQFGHLNPKLGDGRAILLGEFIGRDGNRRDMQLKGAGRTIYSRGGDGRLALGPALREYLMSEAFAALGIPTTRSLAVVASGDPVVREAILPGAILTRIAASHVRIGTFQFFAVRSDHDAIKALAGYVIARHYPHAASASNPYRALLDAVIERQADLIARWQLVGFIHGVMNTDNMAISGESIDFGPCAFMDGYDPAQVYSYVDQTGRYAYANQPRIAQWNLARFAETLLPLLADTKGAAIAQAQDAIDGFAAKFDAAFTGILRLKLGLTSKRDGDLALGQDLFQCMADCKADFTLTFRRLCDVAADSGESSFRDLFDDPTAIGAWLQKWRNRLADDASDTATRRSAMRRSNPAFIPRNHRVEEALHSAVTAGDLAPFETLLAVLSKPFDDQPGHESYAEPPRPEQVVQHTFCGT